MTTCNRCLFTSDIAHIHEDGECEYCKLHDRLEAQSDPENLDKELAKIRKAGKGKKYDCLMGISGGLDSSTLLYAAVKKWGLRPLVIHFDNHYNTPEANYNIGQLIRRLGVDCIVYYVNKIEYDNLNFAFVVAGVPDADIPNDIAMTKLMYQTAEMYGIKYILNGHDFREEGSTPAAWTYMDAKYIQSVFSNTCPPTKLRNYPLFTFWDQIRAGLKGIKQVRPFHYIEDRTALEHEMIDAIEFRDYGGKHCENVYTEFVGGWLLPKYFGIDKRRVYYSALIRSSRMTKAQALKKLETPHEFTKFDQLPFSVTQFANNKGKREDFERYNFKRYKYLIWLLAKLKVVPYTFYVKYAK